MRATFPAPGDTFEDRYEILRRVGQGGFATVMLARQTDLEREVALKIMNPSSNPWAGEATRAEMQRTVRRFEREARLISNLRDPHTVRIFDFGKTEDGLLYMVMEYVEGRTIKDFVVEEGAVEEERVVEILRQALESLEEAHAHGVLHRDIKPHNIMVYDHLDRRDRVKVLDFGIAKVLRQEGSKTQLTAEGILIGTPRYMSPEQILGEKMKPGSDLYSLGLVVYEMLTGEKAVKKESSMEIMEAHLDPVPVTLPEDLEVKPGLRVIVDTMLEKEPRLRFGRAREVLDALEEWDADLEATTKRLVRRDEWETTRKRDVDPSPSDEPPVDVDVALSPALRAPARNPIVYVVAGLVGTLALAALVWLLTLPNEPTQAVSSADGDVTSEESAPPPMADRLSLGRVYVRAAVDSARIRARAESPRPDEAVEGPHDQKTAAGKERTAAARRKRSEPSEPPEEARSVNTASKRSETETGVEVVQKEETGETRDDPGKTGAEGTGEEVDSPSALKPRALDAPTPEGSDGDDTPEEEPKKSDGLDTFRLDSE